MSLKSVFIYYIIKIKYLLNLWIHFNSVNSSEIALFPKMSIKKKEEADQINITGVKNKKP